MGSIACTACGTKLKGPWVNESSTEAVRAYRRHKTYECPKRKRKAEPVPILTNMGKKALLCHICGKKFTGPAAAHKKAALVHYAESHPKSAIARQARIDPKMWNPKWVKKEK